MSPAMASGSGEEGGAKRLSFSPSAGTLQAGHGLHLTSREPGHSRTVANHPKPDIVRHVLRRIEASGARPKAGRPGLPASSAIDALGAARGSLRIHSRPCAVKVEIVEAPFVHVSRQVFDPKRACPLWKFPDR